LLDHFTLLQPHAEDLVNKLIERAKIGDSWAMKLCIDRLIPPIKKDDSICFDLPEGDLGSPENMLKIVESMTQAVASGQLSVVEAEKLSEFLNHQRKTIKDAKRKQEWGGLD
jgi:hypothetical protein